MPKKKKKLNIFFNDLDIHNMSVIKFTSEQRKNKISITIQEE